MSTPESKDVGVQDPAQENKQSEEATIQPPVIDSSDSMDDEALQEAYEHSFKNIAEGSVVAGVVLKLSSSNVVVDVGFKSEGLIPLEEFRDKAGNVSVEVGDTLDVFLERTEDKHGHVVISRQKAERMKVWESLEQAYHDQTIISGRVIERIKGGLAVDVGVRAFLPGSQVDVQPVRNMDSLCGKELEMRVIKVNRRRGNIVLSRKAILEEETSKMKEQTLKELEEGKVIPGIVKNTTDYGAFVDLGGIDGLLHITDMSWGRVNHPSDLFEVGDEIEVKILKFDPANGKVSLGYKQLGDDPWASAQRRYTQGARVFAKVVSLTDYGAFVELEEGVEGLCHVSEFSDQHVEDPEAHFKVDQEIEVKIIKLNLLERKIGLSAKSLQEGVEGDANWSYTPEVATASIGDIAGKELGELKKRAGEAAEGGGDDES